MGVVRLGRQRETVSRSRWVFPSPWLNKACSVEVEEDTKIPNAATIKVVKQDHTLANLLRSYVLLSHPIVVDTR